MSETTVGATAPATGGTGGQVALVIHRRLAESSADAYEAWQERVGARLARWPGFLDRTVIRPNPPVQVDWVIVQHFRDVESARGWLQSTDRAELAAEIQDHFIGNDEVHLITENARHREEAVSVLISSAVDPERETEFLAWQRRIAAAESRCDGFVGHKVERPVPGVQDEWVVILSFDTDEHLDRWLESPERARLLEQGKPFNSELRLTKASYGFGFWTADAQAAAEPVGKGNLLVLLMLYPVVFLWGYFIADPLFAAHGVPFWLSLFIGNLVSTQLLGWFLVPWAFRRFSWWVSPKVPRRVNLIGYGVVIALYVVSMAVYALLIALE